MQLRLKCNHAKDGHVSLGGQTIHVDQWNVYIMKNNCKIIKRICAFQYRFLKRSVPLLLTKGFGSNHWNNADKLCDNDDDYAEFNL